MEIATGVVGYIYREEIHNGLESGLSKLMDDRHGSAAWALMDEIENDVSIKLKNVFQKFLIKFQCCGASGPEDYAKRGREIPPRCCLDFYADECPAERINQLGCADALKPFLMQFSTLLSVVGGLIILVQVIIILS